MVISQNGAGHLQIHTDWPSPLKNKGVFFVKREKAGIPDLEEEEDEDLLDHLTCGDVHPNVLGKNIRYRTLLIRQNHDQTIFVPGLRRSLFQFSRMRTI